jgi:hypothetical protein
MTTYTTFTSEIRGNKFSVLVVSGKYNYISVSKLTNNPFRTSGREFSNYDEAVKAYKTPEMKSFLFQIETGLLTPTNSFIS